MEDRWMNANLKEFPSGEGGRRFGLKLLAQFGPICEKRDTK
jgi:hypothetical protein